MPKWRATIKVANSLIEKNFPNEEDLQVDKTISQTDTDFVFITKDGNKIIKFEDNIITDGLPVYFDLSSLEAGCNICKLLKYKICSDPPLTIIVMENCGEDLYSFFKKTGEYKMNFKQLLQLSLDLLKQIICLQHPSNKDPSNETPGVVHGDIKPENVAVKVMEDGETLDVRLIDLDRVKQIKFVNSTYYQIDMPNFTQWVETNTLNGETYTRRRSYALNIEDITKIEKNKQIIIEVFKQFPDIKNIKNFDFIRAYSNVPNFIVETKRSYQNPRIEGTHIEFLHIIDLCSWCYIVLIGLYFHGIENINTFIYNALLIIVTNIIIPNSDKPNPGRIPIDWCKKSINKDYCDKVVNALTALLQLFDHASIANKNYTDNILKLFFTLIQECSNSDELIRRFHEKPDLISAFRRGAGAGTGAGDGTGAGAGGGIRITRRRRLRTRWRRRRMPRRRTHHKKSRMY